MDLFLNKEKIFNKPSNVEETVYQLLDRTTKSYLKQNEIIASITLDNEVFDATSDNQIFELKTNNFKAIDITVTTNEELTAAAINACDQTLDSLDNKLIILVEQYKKENFAAANRLFIEVIEVTDLFIELISLIHHSLKRIHKGRYIKTNKIHELEIHLLSTLKAMLPAKEKNDTIMLCDLLEYELIDNLSKWKKEVIPELQKLNHT
jgi:flavin-binding protein dodecin